MHHYKSTLFFWCGGRVERFVKEIHKWSPLSCMKAFVIHKIEIINLINYSLEKRQKTDSISYMYIKIQDS